MLLSALAVSTALAIIPPPNTERTPNLYKLPDGCKDAATRVVDRYGKPLPMRLGDLPKGALMYAVDRRIDGCPVLVIVYGEASPDDPNPLPQRYRYAPVPAPPTRADAPSNRR